MDRMVLARMPHIEVLRILVVLGVGHDEATETGFGYSGGDTGESAHANLFCVAGRLSSRAAGSLFIAC